MVDNKSPAAANTNAGTREESLKTVSAAAARAMLDLAETQDGYALGTGNSVPEYIADEKFLALIGVATGLSAPGPGA